MKKAQARTEKGKITRGIGELGDCSLTTWFFSMTCYVLGICIRLCVCWCIIIIVVDEE